MTSSWETYCGRTQPSSSGKVTPLSWSSTTAGSSAEGPEAWGGAVEGEAVGGSPAGAAPVETVPGGGPASAAPPPSSPRTSAPVTIAATRTAAAAVTATALPRPVPTADGAGPPVNSGTVGCGGGTGGCPAGSGARRCSVQAVPSHQRSRWGDDGSRYQPGGGVMLMRAL